MQALSRLAGQQLRYTDLIYAVSEWDGNCRLSIIVVHAGSEPVKIPACSSHKTVQP